MIRVPAPLILASASPRRQDLLREAGYAFEVVPPAAAEEVHDPALSLPDLTEENARRKAKAVAADYPEAIVLAADTLVSLDGVAFGKPVDHADAVRMLQTLAGRTHRVCTGVCFLRASANRSAVFHEITEVTFRPMAAAEIERYLTLIQPFDKAGAYAAQEHGSLIIESTEGSWTNVVGLPMERVAMELARFEGEMATS